MPWIFLIGLGNELCYCFFVQEHLVCIGWQNSSSLEPQDKKNTTILGGSTILTPILYQFLY